jgi:hypothetical protein
MEIFEMCNGGAASMVAWILEQGGPLQNADERANPNPQQAKRSLSEDQRAVGTM